MQFLNWLYVQNPRASLHLDHDALRIRAPDVDTITLPLLGLEGIVCFGWAQVSTPLMHRCAEDGRTVVFLDSGGRFKARIEGPCHGNVLLRVDQYRIAGDAVGVREIARPIVAAKLQSERASLLRAARERQGADAGDLERAITAMGHLIEATHVAETTDALRGYEGEGAARYFGVFPLLMNPGSGLSFDRRARRPPRGPVNALLSFLYTMLRVEVNAALEATGLDPQVGFLHRLRPGRPALALDLMEELRVPLADRVALTLINRRQLSQRHFIAEPGGGSSMTAEGRQIVLAQYRFKKIEEVQHPMLKQRVPWGLIAHAQARILARHLRGDFRSYVPFLAK